MEEILDMLNKKSISMAFDGYIRNNEPIEKSIDIMKKGWSIFDKETYDEKIASVVSKLNILTTLLTLKKLEERKENFIDIAKVLHEVVDELAEISNRPNRIDRNRKFSFNIDDYREGR